MTAGAAAVHYLRFKVPITVAAGVAAAACSLLALALSVAPGITQAWLNTSC